MRIGVDLGGSKIEAAALDGRGRELGRQRLPTPRGDYDATVAAITALVSGIEGELGHGRARVGIGIPGTISPATGLVKNANSTWLIGRPLKEDLATSLGRPVRIANDANCFTVSEAVDGAGAGAACVFGVIIGTGCGGGIAMNGQAWIGANAIAGEWGHNPLPWMTREEMPGPDCYCGRKGCIETYISGTGLAADHLRATGERMTADDIATAATASDPGASASMARYEERMARSLAAVINFLDPDVIVLGGGVSKITRLYENVPHLWGPYLFSDEVTTGLVPARHGDAGGVRGAAWLWPAEGGGE